MRNYFRNKEKVLKNLKGAYQYYIRSAQALDKASDELLDKAQQSRNYVKKSIEKMDRFGGAIDKQLLAGYLTNAKRNEENAKNLMKRSVAFHAAADYVQSMYTIIKYADLGKDAPDVKMPKWASRIINGDIPTVEEIIVEPPTYMEVPPSEINDELDALISQVRASSTQAKVEKNDLEKKLEEISG